MKQIWLSCRTISLKSSDIRVRQAYDFVSLILAIYEAMAIKEVIYELFLLCQILNIMMTSQDLYW